MTPSAHRNILRALRAEGANRSNGSIAREHGATTAYVRRLRASLGIPPYTGRGDRSPAIDWSQADWSQPPAVIAEALGCPVETVRHRRCREGRHVRGRQ